MSNVSPSALKLPQLLLPPPPPLLRRRTLVPPADDESIPLRARRRKP
jgi:hypothetical protein